MAETSLDGKRLVNEIQVVVYIPKFTYLKMKLATWLLILVSIISPFSLEIKQGVRVQRIKCQRCNSEFSASLLIGTETVVACPDCRYQFLADHYGGQVIYPSESRFGCPDCGWIENFGFVPSVRCEYHN